VHELGHDQPKTTKVILDIATWHTSSEEAVEAIFVQGDGKMTPDGSRGAPPNAASKGTKRRAKGSKKGAKAVPLTGHSYY
jgi:hypothetical protein